MTIRLATTVALIAPIVLLAAPTSAAAETDQGRIAAGPSAVASDLRDHLPRPELAQRQDEERLERETPLEQLRAEIKRRLKDLRGLEAQVTERESMAKELERAAEEGNGETVTLLCELHSDIDRKFEAIYMVPAYERSANAVKWCHVAAERGDARAQFEVGYRYGDGRGVSADDKKGANWIRKAAGQGYYAARVRLGDLYRDGRGMRQDNSEALRWYLEAGNQWIRGDLTQLEGKFNVFDRVKSLGKKALFEDKDYALALRVSRFLLGLEGRYSFWVIRGRYYLGVMHRGGLGVQQDYEKAVNLLREPAAMGLAGAQGLIGEMYYKGEGVPKNYVKAGLWLDKAADRGSASAQYYLGVMYTNGDGVPQDYVLAHKWLNLAAARLDPESERPTRKLAIWNRDTLTAKMTGEQVARAQIMAREWNALRKSIEAWDLGD